MTERDTLLRKQSLRRAASQRIVAMLAEHPEQRADAVEVLTSVAMEPDASKLTASWKKAIDRVNSSFDAMRGEAH